MQNIQWTRIYEQEAGTLLGVAYRYVKDRKQAEDIVQNAFVKAIEKSDTFRGSGAFEAWLRRVVVNEALMHLRAKNPVLSGLDDRVQDLSEETEQYDENSFAQVIRNADFTKEDLLETANLLPEHHRIVFYLYAVDGYSHKDIAQQLNMAEGTSKSHLNRARKKLQELLYQKAMDMKKHRKKPFFLLALFSTLFVKAKANPVDTLYKEAFSNFTLPPPPMPSGIELAGTTVSVGVSSGVIASVAGAVAIGGAAVVGTVAYFSNDETTMPPEEIQSTIEYQTPEQPVFTDFSEDTAMTIEPIPNPIKENIPMEEKMEENKIEESQIEKPAEEKLPPVVIKKTIVIDTVYED